MTIVVPIRKQGVGSHTLLGTLYHESVKQGRAWEEMWSDEKKRVIFAYDHTGYTHYSDSLTGRELAMHDIILLREQGWVVEEING